MHGYSANFPSAALKYNWYKVWLTLMLFIGLHFSRSCALPVCVEWAKHLWRQHGNVYMIAFEHISLLNSTHICLFKEYIAYSQIPAAGVKVCGNTGSVNESSNAHVQVHAHKWCFVPCIPNPQFACNSHTNTTHIRAHQCSVRQNRHVHQNRCIYTHNPKHFHLALKSYIHKGVHMHNTYNKNRCTFAL